MVLVATYVWLTWIAISLYCTTAATSITENRNPTAVVPAYFFDSLIEWFFEFMSMLLNGYLTLFFVITGIISNLFSIYIFLRCERGSTPVIQYYLFLLESKINQGRITVLRFRSNVTLTIWQTALLANAFLLYCLPLLLFDQFVSQGNYVYIYPYVYTFANTTHTGSVWVVLTLTIDRYLALCQPLKHRAIGKRRRVKRLMILVSMFAAVFSFPRFFEVHVEQVFDSETHTWNPTIQRSSIFENRMYWSVYHVILPTLFVTLCPCLLLFGLTVRISFALRQAIAKRKCIRAPNADIDNRKKTAACTKKEHKSNIMLVLVIAKFLISDILPTVTDVTEHVFLIWGKRFRQSCRRLLLSKNFGVALYRIIYGSEPDLASMCPSSLNTAHQTTLQIYSSTKSMRKPTSAASFQVGTKNYVNNGLGSTLHHSHYCTTARDPSHNGSEATRSDFGCLNEYESLLGKKNEDNSQ